ncbi:MAG: hypothetical protein ACRC6V_06885 [Bacteroidales bacterium]
MVDEYEYTVIKRLIGKVTTDITNFTTIDSDTVVMNINGSMSIHPIGIKDKTTGTEIYKRDLVSFNNYKILNKAFSYLYHEIAEKDVREALIAISKEQDEYRNSVINYLND